jgi:hypothetical protein
VKSRVHPAHLWDLDLVQEARAQVLQHNAVRGGEEREHVADEVLLAVVQLVPVRLVRAEVDLLGCRSKAETGRLMHSLLSVLSMHMRQQAYGQQRAVHSCSRMSGGFSSLLAM